MSNAGGNKPANLEQSEQSRLAGGEGVPKKERPPPPPGQLKHDIGGVVPPGVDPYKGRG